MAYLASSEQEQNSSSLDYDTSEMKSFVKDNLRAETAENPEALKDKSLLDHFVAGTKMSTLGLAIKGEPNSLDENAEFSAKIAYKLGNFLPELPVMEAAAAPGQAIGAAIGALSPVPGGAAIGAFVGGAASSFGIPAALRRMMVDYYDKSGFKNFSDFWSTLSTSFMEGSKEAGIGVATLGAGKLVGGAASKVAVPTIAKTAQISTEIATMSTLGAALEGHLPDGEDMVTSGIVIGGLHTFGPAYRKAKNVFSRTGTPPEQFALDSERNPVIRQDALSNNKDLPDAYAHIDAEAPKKIAVPADAEPVRSYDPDLMGAEVIDVLKPKTEEAPKAATKEEKIIESEDLKHFKDRISYDTGDSKLDKSISQFGDFKDNFVEYVVDAADPLKQLMQSTATGETRVIDDFYKMTRLAKSAASGRAEAALKYETVDFNTLQKNGNGLMYELRPIEKEMANFDAYLAARRTKELTKRGIENTGFDPAKADAVLKELGPKYEEFAKKTTAYRNRNLDYLAQAGLISKDSAKTFKNLNELYVPMNRIFEIEHEAQKSGKKVSNVSLKKLVGAGEAVGIQSPILSIMKDTVTFMNFAEANRPKMKLMEWAAKNPEAHDFKIVSEFEPIKKPSGELAKLFKQYGIKQDEVDVFAFAKRQRELAPNEFDFWEDGKRVVVRTENEAIARAVNILGGDPTSTSLLIKTLALPAKALRLGTTITPAFALKNAFVDQVTRSVLTKHGTTYFDVVEAFGDLMDKQHSVAYKEALKAGLFGGTFQDLQTEYLDANIYDMAGQTGFMSRAFNLIKSPYRAARAINEMAEQATRLAEFKQATKGNYSAANLMEGVFSGKEVTTDFSRRGSNKMVVALNAITAFQNASVQGLEKTIRAVKEDKGKLATAAFASITVPTILTYLANNRDQATRERVQDLPQWQRDMYWIFPTDDWQKKDSREDVSKLPDYLKRSGPNGIEVNRGEIYRFAKPRELGLFFGTALERLFDKFFTDNPDAFKGFAETIYDTIAPPLIPNAIVAPLETYMNKNVFTNQPIVSGTAERLLPELQYNDGTSELSKQLSTAIAEVPYNADRKTVAPAVMDNWIRSWGGALGTYTLQLADTALVKSGIVDNAPPSKDFASDIFTKSFMIRHPNLGAQPVLDLEEKYRQYSKMFDSSRALQKRGDRDKAQELMISLRKNPDFTEVMRAGQAISNMRVMKHKIAINPSIERDKKSEQIDGLNWQILNIAKSVVRKSKNSHNEDKGED